MIEQPIKKTLNKELKNLLFVIFLPYIVFTLLFTSTVLLGYLNRFYWLYYLIMFIILSSLLIIYNVLMSKKLQKKTIKYKEENSQTYLTTIINLIDANLHYYKDVDVVEELTMMHLYPHLESTKGFFYARGSYLGLPIKIGYFQTREEAKRIKLGKITKCRFSSFKGFIISVLLQEDTLNEFLVMPSIEKNPSMERRLQNDFNLKPFVPFDNNNLDNLSFFARDVIQEGKDVLDNNIYDSIRKLNRRFPKRFHINIKNKRIIILIDDAQTLVPHQFTLNNIAIINGLNRHLQILNFLSCLTQNKHAPVSSLPEEFEMK